MDLDSLEEKKQLRFVCLDLACRQTVPDEQGKFRDLNSDEAIAMADAFYKFVTKQELN